MNSENKDDKKGKWLSLLLLFLKNPQNLPLIASLVGGAAVVTTGAVLLAPRQSNSSSMVSSIPSSSQSSSVSSISSSSSVSSSANAQNFTVSFNAMGGVGVTNQTVLQGQTIVEPSTVYGLMEFAGWYLSNDGGQTLGSEWNFATNTVTSDVNLYAKWDIPFITDYDTLANGDGSLLAIDATGVLWSWGENNNGFLGIGNTQNHLFPTRVDASFFNEQEAIIHVSSMDSHSILLTNQGRVFGFGATSDWALGVDPDTNDDFLVPTLLNIPLNGPTEMVLNAWASDYSTWILTSTGRLLVTGQNYYDELGVTTESSYAEGFTEVPFTSLSDDEIIVDVFVNDEAHFALSNLGKVYSWGSDYEGRLGLGNMDDAVITTPTLVNFADLNPNEFVISISFFRETFVALTNQQRVFGWGVTDDGELAPSEFDLDPYLVPTLIDLSFLDANDAIVEVKAGRDHTVFHTEAGKIYQVGDNSDGQLGTGDNEDSIAPIELDLSAFIDDETIVEILAGNDITVIATNAGRWYGIGDNTDYLISYDPNIEEHFALIEINRIGLNLAERFTQIAMGEQHTIGLTSEGRLFGWGGNYSGQLAQDETLESSIVPKPIYIDLNNGESIAKIYTKGYTSYALTSAGRMFGWGRNENGQLGLGTNTNAFTPTLMNFNALNVGEKIVEFYPDYSNSYILTNAGRLLGWGEGTGTLGVGDILEPYMTPTIITIPNLQVGETIGSMFVANMVRFVITSTGRVFAWGNNSNYGLGLNTLIDPTIPTLVTFADLVAGEKVVSIAYNNSNAMALTSNNRVFAWGANFNDQLGTGSDELKTNIEAPTLIDIVGIVDNTIRAIYANSNGTYYFLTTNQELYAIGNNGNGQLGIDSPSDLYGAVTKVEGFNLAAEDSLVMMTMTGFSTMLLTENGRIFSWAADDYGKLLTINEDRQFLNYRSPIEVKF